MERNRTKPNETYNERKRMLQASKTLRNIQCIKQEPNCQARIAIVVIFQHFPHRLSGSLRSPRTSAAILAISSSKLNGASQLDVGNSKLFPWKSQTNKQHWPSGSVFLGKSLYFWGVSKSFAASAPTLEEKCDTPDSNSNVPRVADAFHSNEKQFQRRYI